MTLTLPTAPATGDYTRTLVVSVVVLANKTVDIMPNIESTEPTAIDLHHLAHHLLKYPSPSLADTTEHVLPRRPTNAHHSAPAHH